MDEQRIILSSKSDAEHLVDLITTLVGMAILVYTANPEPFNRAIDKFKDRIHNWRHKISIWEALCAIRSLPETDE